MLKKVLSYLPLLTLVVFFLPSAFASDACSPTNPSPTNLMVHIPNVGNPKTPASGVADGWVLVYKDSALKQMVNEVYCHGNKIQFATSAGKANFEPHPDCTRTACTRTAATEKSSTVALKGKFNNTNKFVWGRDLSVNGFTVLYNFNGPPVDGSTPYAPLMRDATGNFYGTTQFGGSLGEGTIFELDSTGAVTMLYSFGSNGDVYPKAGVAQDSAGNLYGTTSRNASDGRHPRGTVFRLDTNNVETILYQFSGGTDGGAPLSGLVLDSSGNLFGTTELGGSGNAGTVFSLNGTTLTTLYSFPSGSNPYDSGKLAIDAAGNLYGTTYGGGSSGLGTVFKVDPFGNETLLYSFSGSTTDGCNPEAAPVIDASGNLFGTTFGCGSGNAGTVWELSAAGTETILYNFTGAADGGNLYAGVVLDDSGNAYGVTTSGGDSNGDGVLFAVSPSGTETVLHTFSSATDGAKPFGGVLLASDGNLYGTASTGGSSGVGTIWGYSLLATLAVTLEGNGSGTVTSNPAGIDCPTTCSASYSGGVVVSLTATPGANSTFAGWGGACSGKQDTCQVTVNGSTGVTATFNVTVQQPTTTLVSSLLNPSRYGQIVNFTAVVTSQSGGTPTGSVSFYDGTNLLATQQLINGTAQYSTGGLVVGSHSITAAYGGDSNNLGSTSSPLLQVTNQATTTVAITSSVNPASYGQPVLLTAAVSSQYGGSTTGTVTFYDETSEIGSVQVSNNAAILTLSTLPVGNNSIVATYSGDSNYLGSISPRLKQRVVNAISRTTLTSSLNPSNYGDNVVFIAAVTGQYGVTPTGIVTFKDGTAILGGVTLNGGVAQYSSPTLTKGKHVIHAVYSSDGYFKASRASLHQVVK